MKHIQTCLNKRIFRPLIIFLLTLTFISLQAVQSFAQTNVCTGDTISLDLPTFRGNIQWQQSTDSAMWTNISGATYQPYKIVAATTKYYRAVVAEGNCSPIYTPGEKFIVTICSNFTCGTSTISDFDGNTYNTVQIGNQCWMKENLKTKKYRDNTTIPNATNNTAWQALTTGAYADYDNSNSNSDIYGRLYNWFAVNDAHSLCPTGWHVPSDVEWSQLETTLGGISNANGKLKETGTAHWNSPNTGATNESGFTALPGGSRIPDGTYANINSNAFFWTATSYSVTDAWYRVLYSSGTALGRTSLSKNYGYSVRCISDNCIPPAAPTGSTNTPSQTQIVWSWNTVSGATGYKWNTTNDYASAIDMGTDAIKIETNLICNTPYTRYVWAYNSCGNSIVLVVTQSTSACAAFVCGTSTIADFDGNSYNTVSVGNQCWMKENLKSTHYSNGIAMIDGTSAGDITGNYTTKYYFDYANTPANTNIYGKLYTWAAVMNGATSSNANPSGVQGVCPTGWHVPSDAEWTQLTDYLGGESVAGGKMKEAGTTHWNSPNSGDNLSGFTTLPGGHRLSDGTFERIVTTGYFWSTTNYQTSYGWRRQLYFSSSSVSRSFEWQPTGISVRCLKD